MRVFAIMIVVTFSEVYNKLKHHILLFKYMQFIVWQLYLNNARKNRTHEKYFPQVIEWEISLEASNLAPTVRSTNICIKFLPSKQSANKWTFTKSLK